MNRLSDRGSIPLRSTTKAAYLRGFLVFVLHFVLHAFEIAVCFIRHLTALIVYGMSIDIF